MELNKYIVIKFSELSLKGGNKKEFINVLLINIKNKIEDYSFDGKVKNAWDHIEIFSEEDLDKIFIILKEIVGISFFSFFYKCKADKKIIEKVIKEALIEYPKGTTFRVSAKLIDNDMFDDKDKMIEWLAWYGTNELEYKINLKNYEVDFNIRLENNEATLFFKKIRGIYGLPAGGNGKALTLLSGGIDSPVAAYKTITRGINTSFITFLTSNTSTKETLSKIFSLANEVDKFNGIHGKLFLVNFTEIQKEIMKLKDSSYRIILLRRYFLRFSKVISQKYGFKFLITGDSLGQVASQTPESMTIIDQATDQLVVRPLVSMSKNEIIGIAEKINTYKISIKEGEDMCLIFAPKNPIIFPKQYKILELESLLVDMDKIIDSIIKKDMRVINLKGEKNV